MTHALAPETRAEDTVDTTADDTAPVPDEAGTVWELMQGFSMSGSTVGLYTTHALALAAAETVVAGYVRSQNEDDDFDHEAYEEAWADIIWFEHTDPRFGYTEIRGQYGFQSYFLLAERTLNTPR